MNEIFKANTASKFLRAVANHTISLRKPMRNIDIAHRLGFNVTSYITMIRNPKQYNKIPKHAWEKFRVFVNSGESLNNYQYKSDMEDKAAPDSKDTTAVPGTSPDQLSDHNKVDELQGAVDALQGGKLVEASPLIKEILKVGTPLNTKILALIQADAGQDPATCEIKLIVDIEIRVNGRKVEI